MEFPIEKESTVGDRLIVNRSEPTGRMIARNLSTSVDYASNADDADKNRLI